MKPQLSVIIPTFRRSDSLEKLLDRLFTQRNIILDIIVVDQNEADYFEGPLLDKLNKTNRIESIPPNASLARNIGFIHAKAPYILFIDDDLLPEDDFCSKGVNVFSEYPLIKSFVPLVFPLDGKEEWTNFAKNKRIENYPGRDDVFSITDSISAAVFFETAYFENSGGFDVFLFDFAKASEDVELFLRMQRKGMTLWFVPSIEIFHDENTAGGCEMRTAGYWATRKKNLRAMAFRNRIHQDKPGNLSLKSLYTITRSALLNKKAILAGGGHMFKEMDLMLRSIKESKIFFENHKSYYNKSSVDFIDAYRGR